MHILQPKEEEDHIIDSKDEEGYSAYWTSDDIPLADIDVQDEDEVYDNIPFVQLKNQANTSVNKSAYKVVASTKLARGSKKWYGFTGMLS